MIQNNSTCQWFLYTVNNDHSRKQKIVHSAKLISNTVLKRYMKICWIKYCLTKSTNNLELNVYNTVPTINFTLLENYHCCYTYYCLPLYCCIIIFKINPCSNLYSIQSASKPSELS
jgi:hypothetical protein